MAIQSFALNQLLSGLAIATAQFEQGRSAADISSSFLPYLPSECADPQLTPAVEPLLRLYPINGHAGPAASEPEAVARAFFEAARELHQITETSHPEVARWAANASRVWSRGLASFTSASESRAAGSGLSRAPAAESAIPAPSSRPVPREDDAELVEWLRRFIEHSPEPMGVVACHEDGSAELVMFNRENRTRWGLGEKDMVGFSVENFFYPEDHAMIREFIVECLQTGHAKRTGVRMLRRAGGHLLVDMYVGRVDDTRYAYFQVINETQREQALGQNRMFEAVLRNAREPLVLFKFGEDGTPTGILTSAGFNEMLGYRPGEMDGRPVADFIAPRFRLTYATKLRQFRQTGVFDWKEAELLAKDGRRVLVDIYAEASDVGGAQFAVASFEDAHARIAAERDAAEAQKVDIIASVSAGTAHDINNIATILMGGIDLLRMKYPNDDFLDEMIAKVGMLSGMVNGIRRLTDNVEREGGIDLHAILKESDVRHATPKAKDVRIRFELAEDPWMVAGPNFSVWQIVFNFVKNAVEAMEKSTERILTLGTENVEILNDAALRRLDPDGRFPDARPGEFLKVTVADTGPGIPPEILPRIFEDYFSTKSDADVSRGRGLSTSQRSVAKRGGLVAVATEIGRGTTFEIYLPRTEPRKTPTPPPAAASSAILPDERWVSHGNEVILVADDDEGIRNQFQRILKFYRYQEVLFAGRSDEVIEIARKRPDLTAVVMDWRMPGITGDELLRELHELNPDLPVLVNTGLVPSHGSPYPNVQFVQKLTGAVRVGRALRLLIQGKPVD
jgi:PAS domain S-box-containing protein